MNWREGLRRIVKAIGIVYWAGAALVAGMIWYDEMQTYYLTRGSVWEWNNFSDAFRAGCVVLAWAFVWYLVGVAIVRGARWISQGFAKEP